MSDNRTYGGYGRDENRSREGEYRDRERFGRTDERSARRGAGYAADDEDRYRSQSYGGSDRGFGDRDDYRRGGYESRESYYGDDYGRGSGGGEYGRGGGSSGDYLSNTGRGYGRSSYSGVDFDRGRDRGFGGGSDSGYGERSDYFRSGSSGFGSRGSYGDDWSRRSLRDRSSYGGSDANRSGDRSFFERAGDEISSWFGDEDAERRRDQDRRHAGKGPKSYTRSDDRIRDDINDRLTDDYQLDASYVEVSVKDREVTLNGHVSSREEKRRAEDVAERVSGVSHVQNNLRVGSSASGNGGSSSYGQGSSSGTSAGSSASTAGTSSVVGNSTGSGSASTISGRTTG